MILSVKHNAAENSQNINILASDKTKQNKKNRCLSSVILVQDDPCLK